MHTRCTSWTKPSPDRPNVDFALERGARVARVRGKLVVTSAHRRRVANFIAPASCCEIGNNLDI
jgi:hypothetical protein